MSRADDGYPRKYRHAAAYQAATDADDALGEPIRAWTTLATFRVEVRGLTGREAMQAAQVDATLTTAVVQRYVPEGHPARPRPGGRYLHDGRTLYVVSVADPTGERRELKALCSEDAAP